MKKGMLALLGTVCLCLMGVSTALADTPFFTMKAQGSEGCMGCMSAQITLCGQTYTVKEGTPIQCAGTTSVIPNIPVKLLWGGYGSCGSVKELCSGGMSFSGSNANGTICTKSDSSQYSNLNYSIKKTGKSGSVTNWEISFTMDHYVKGGIQ